MRSGELERRWLPPGWQCRRRPVQASSMAAIAVPDAQHQRLQIELIEIDLLKPDPENARAHTPKQILQVARSITNSNFNQPILVDAENNVIAGHARLEALKLLGHATAPCIRLADLTPAQAKAYWIVDNELSDNSKFNEKQLTAAGPYCLPSTSSRHLCERGHGRGGALATGPSPCRLSVPHRGRVSQVAAPPDAPDCGRPPFYVHYSNGIVPSRLRYPARARSRCP
jgi:hypothetical protein